MKGRTKTKPTMNVTITGASAIAANATFASEPVVELTFELNRYGIVMLTKASLKANVTVQLPGAQNASASDSQPKPSPSANNATATVMTDSNATAEVQPAQETEKSIWRRLTL